jgi:large subunit ribosomal protein L21
VIDAVIRTGGKQYRVQEGGLLNVATMDAEPGSRVELRDVLLVSNDGTVTIGNPNVDGALVVAEVIEHGKGKKVVNFKYKAKVRYRRKHGHRQGYTRVRISEISFGGATAKAPERKEVTERPSGFAGRVESPDAEPPAPEAPAEEALETQVPTAEAPRRTRSRARAAEPPEESESTETPRPTRRRRAASRDAAPEQADEDKPED